MSEFKILSYEPTPSIDKQTGLIHVLLSNIWRACFKVIPKADGGFFIAPATVRTEPEDSGKMKWADGVQPDSKTLKDEFYAALRDFFKEQDANPSGLPF